MENNNLEKTTPKEILIVDKDPSVASILDYILSQSNYKTHVITTSEEALAYTKVTPSLSLIILDFDMPKINDTPLCKKIVETNPHLLLLCMAGQNYENYLNEAYNQGALAALYKPFDVEDVLLKIQTLFGSILTQS